MADRQRKIIDVHAHILPGIDDGARDMEEALVMLKLALLQGISTIIATPHYDRELDKETLEHTIEELRRVAENAELDCQILLGQEIKYYDGLVDDLKEGNVLTLAGSRYVLVEFNIDISYQKLYKGVRQLVLARYIPIFAHVEQYICLRKKQERIAELNKCGCIFQMNYDSLCGNLFNSEARWCKRKILEENIHLLGTDMHRINYRKPNIRKSMIWLEKHTKAEYLHGLINENANIILGNGIIE